MTNQMSQNLSWFRQPAVSNYLTTDRREPLEQSLNPCEDQDHDEHQNEDQDSLKENR